MSRFRVFVGAIAEHWGDQEGGKDKDNGKQAKGSPNHVKGQATCVAAMSDAADHIGCRLMPAKHCSAWRLCHCGAGEGSWGAGLHLENVKC
jgi:hypothetical protein